MIRLEQVSASREAAATLMAASEVSTTRTSVLSVVWERRGNKRTRVWAARAGSTLSFRWRKKLFKRKKKVLLARGRVARTAGKVANLLRARTAETLTGTPADASSSTWIAASMYCVESSDGRACEN